MISMNEITNLLSPVVQSSPIKRIIIFGSYARGDATPESDLDMIIDSGGELRGLDVFTWIHNIKKTMPVVTDIYESREIKTGSDLYESIKKEGVVIYERV
ncbi:MAG: nucleotidyltransferase domain-containing protein [Defluviitaleaceae bacterium]|nr:nucleotidyltransferase domain-containing protein [Defluviitaleaceae bacterium]